MLKSNYYVVHLKLTQCCISIISQQNWGKFLRGIHVIEFKNWWGNFLICCLWLLFPSEHTMQIHGVGKEVIKTEAFIFLWTGFACRKKSRGLVLSNPGQPWLPAQPMALGCQHLVACLVRLPFGQPTTRSASRFHHCAHTHSAAKLINPSWFFFFLSFSPFSPKLFFDTT